MPFHCAVSVRMDIVYGCFGAFSDGMDGIYQNNRFALSGECVSMDAGPWGGGKFRRNANGKNHLVVARKGGFGLVRKSKGLRFVKARGE